MDKRMSSNDESFEQFKSFSYENELEKARWYHEDLSNGGWREVKNVQGSTFWLKTFPDNDIPVKVLYKYDLPLSAEQFVDVRNPSNMEILKKYYKKIYVEIGVLAEDPDGRGYIIYERRDMPWPLNDRDFVLFCPTVKEIEWYEKRAFIVSYVDTSHPSKPANEGSCVRATNGGQFIIVIPDEKDPERACTVFGLADNNLNGWVPTKMEFLYASAVPKAFDGYFQHLVEGYKVHLSKDNE